MLGLVIMVAAVTLVYQNCAQETLPSSKPQTSTSPGPTSPPGSTPLPIPPSPTTPPPVPPPGPTPSIADQLKSLIKTVYRFHKDGVGHTFRLDQVAPAPGFIYEGPTFYVFDRTARSQLESLGVWSSLIPVYRCQTTVGGTVMYFLSPLENCESTTTNTYPPDNGPDAGGKHLLGYIYRTDASPAILTQTLWRCTHSVWGTHLTTPVDDNPKDDQPDECKTAPEWIVEFKHGLHPLP